MLYPGHKAEQLTCACYHTAVKLLLLLANCAWWLMHLGMCWNLVTAVRHDLHVISRTCNSVLCSVYNIVILDFSVVNQH